MVRWGSDIPQDSQDSIEVIPVVVLSQNFPARPSSIPEIREFVKRCLSASPLSEEGSREVGETVFRALLEAAGPTGTIQVSFRIFPEHVEVDVLRSDPRLSDGSEISALVASLAPAGRPGAAGGPAAGPVEEGPPNFAGWMAEALRREGLTHEAAARQLGVSVKTVGRWIGGETEPRLRDLRRIQDVFGQLPFP